MNMENNNNDPKKVKPVKGQSMMQQFLLSLVATTISIVLTFGTATIIDKNQKNNAKKEMVMMVIYDFDQTIMACEAASSMLITMKKMMTIGTRLTRCLMNITKLRH